MQRNIAEVANETRAVALFDFFFGGGGGGVSAVEGTSFWNTVRHSFTINFVLAVFLRGVSVRT